MTKWNAHPIVWWMWHIQKMIIINQVVFRNKFSNSLCLLFFALFNLDLIYIFISTDTQLTDNLPAYFWTPSLFSSPFERLIIWGNLSCLAGTEYLDKIPFRNFFRWKIHFWLHTKITAFLLGGCFSQPRSCFCVCFPFFPGWSFFRVYIFIYSLSRQNEPKWMV